MNDSRAAPSLELAPGAGNPLGKVPHIEVIRQAYCDPAPPITTDYADIRMFGLHFRKKSRRKFCTGHSNRHEFRA